MNFKILIIIFFPFILFGQNVKKNIYLNPDNLPISSQIFDSLKSFDIYFAKTTENDSIVYKKIYRVYNVVTLDSTKLNQINSMLNLLTDSVSDPSKTRILHFFDNADKSFKKSLKNKRYWNFIEEHNDKFQTFVFVEKNKKNFNYLRQKFYFDKFNFFKKLFFKDSIFNINHIMIDPNGIIAYTYGKNNLLSVLDAGVNYKLYQNIYFY